MERALSLEDKIKKAEEIYYRRNSDINKKTQIGNSKSKIRYRIAKKITIQTLVSACIFTGIFAVLNTTTQSENIKNAINEILTYNINVESIFQNSFINKPEAKEEEKTTELVDDTEINEEALIEQAPVEETLGAAQTEEIIEATSSIDLETDSVQFIKQNISIIKPLDGVITSRFGLRENVEPFNHTGIDIAANTGTKIVSAMEGIAEIVSTEGCYGKHIKITNGEISTLYAHCNDLYVKEGDFIKQGQEIAEVGSTGNATGPHLHFEIIRNDEYINPDLILDF